MRRPLSKVLELVMPDRKSLLAPACSEPVSVGSPTGSCSGSSRGWRPCGQASRLLALGPCPTGSSQSAASARRRELRVRHSFCSSDSSGSCISGSLNPRIYTFSSHTCRAKSSTLEVDPPSSNRMISTPRSSVCLSGPALHFRNRTRTSTRVRFRAFAPFLSRLLSGRNACLIGRS